MTVPGARAGEAVRPARVQERACAVSRSPQTSTAPGSARVPSLLRLLRIHATRPCTSSCWAASPRAAHPLTTSVLHIHPATMARLPFCSGGITLLRRQREATLWRRVRAGSMRVATTRCFSVARSRLQPAGPPVQALTAKMRPMSTSRGTMVCSQGEAADAVFFLQRGEVDVMHLTQRVTTITAPAVFGEASLLRDTLDAAKKRLSGYRTTLTSMCVAPSPPLLPVLRLGPVRHGSTLST